MNHPWPNPFMSFPFFTNLLFLGQNSFWIWSLPLFAVFGDRLHPHVKFRSLCMLFSDCLGQIGFQTKPGTLGGWKEIFFLLDITVSSSASRGLREICRLLNHCSAMLPDS